MFVPWSRVFFSTVTLVFDCIKLNQNLKSHEITNFKVDYIINKYVIYSDASYSVGITDSNWRGEGGILTLPGRLYTVQCTVK